jgi:hypothetical protein
MQPQTSVHLDVMVGAMRAKMVKFIEDELLDVETLVKETVTPEVLNRAFAEAMKKAVEEEMENFFRWGEGKVLVREAVKAMGRGLIGEEE